MSSPPAAPAPSPYFDSKAVKSKHRYVAWLDGLGTKATMLVSHARAANFVMKIHAACIEARAQCGAHAPDLYPMNDGVFIVSSSREPLEVFVASVMRRLGQMFVDEAEPTHRFMIRGAVAFGIVSAGDELHGNNKDLRASADHVRGVVLGMPLAQAVDAERAAPPFGLVIHESARLPTTPNAEPWTCVLWRWWAKGDAGFVSGLKASVEKHLNWAERHPLTSMYPAEALRRHRAAAEEYFDAEG